jgi:hypothetical protein
MYKFWCRNKNVILAIQEAEIGKANSLQDPHLQNTRAKWAGVWFKLYSTCCKHKALSSNPSPTKKKKKLIMCIIIDYKL